MAFIYELAWFGMYPLSLLFLQVWRVWKIDFNKRERWLALPWLIGTVLSLGWVSVSYDYWWTMSAESQRAALGVMDSAGLGLFSLLVLFLTLPEIWGAVRWFGDGVHRSTLSMLKWLFPQKK